MGPRSRYYVLAVLALIGLLNAADQSVLVVTLPAIQLDFRLTDTQVALVSSAFVVVYALAVLPSGYLSDRVSRRLIIGAGVAIWSLATLLTGLTRSFPQLLLARAGLGIGESSSLPAGVSILGDHFNKRERGRAAGVLMAALQVGAGIGVVVGGIIASRYGWRSAFYLAALPGLILAGLALTMREPLRGSAEPAGLPATSLRDAGWNGFTRLIRIPTFSASALANTFIWFAFTGVGGFAGIYLNRRFGLDAARIGAFAGPPLVFSGLVGNAAGGWLVDWRSRRSARAHLEVATVACWLAAAGWAWLFTASSLVVFEFAFLLTATACQVALPSLLAINQNVVLPSLRGSAVAIQQLATNLVGRAAGLIAIGVAADLLQDLRLAFLLIAPTALALAGICAVIGLRSLARDTTAMEEQWGRRLEPPAASATAVLSPEPRPVG